MNERLSVKYLVGEYNKVYNISRERMNSDDVFVDFKSFIEFLKGMKIDECFIDEYKTEFYTYQFSSDNFRNFVNDDTQKLFLDNTKCQILSRNKNLILDLRVLPNTNANHLSDDSRSSFGFEMKEVTPDGIYRCVIHSSDDFERDFVQFVDNSSLEVTARQNGISLEELKQQFITGKYVGFNNVNTVYFSKNNIVKKDIPKIANALYNGGLKTVFQFVLSGRLFEVDNTFNKFFELTDEELALIESIGIDNEKLKHDENNKEDDITENIVEQFVDLNNLGVDLSPEQELILRRSSRKFEEYKKNTNVRMEKQQEIREKVVLENEKKNDWFNSLENPTNMRIQELKYLKKQIEALEALSNIDSNLLTEGQIKFLEDGKKFVEMFEVANKEEHEIDTGMSDEMRQWYQDYYANEENSSKRK